MKSNPFLAPFENFVMRSINFSSLLPFLVLAFAFKTRSLFGSISSHLVMYILVLKGSSVDCLLYFVK
jgi:hypothetical protein